MLMRLAIVCLVLGITADLHGQNKDSEKEIGRIRHLHMPLYARGT